MKVILAAEATALVEATVKTDAAEETAAVAAVAAVATAPCGGGRSARSWHRSVTRPEAQRNEGDESMFCHPCSAQRRHFKWARARGTQAEARLTFRSSPSCRSRRQCLERVAPSRARENG